MKATIATKTPQTAADNRWSRMLSRRESCRKEGGGEEEEEEGKLVTGNLSRIDNDLLSSSRKWLPNRK